MMRHSILVLLLLPTWAPCLFSQAILRELPYYASDEGNIREKQIEKAKASVPDYFVMPSNFKKEAARQFTEQCAALENELTQLIGEEAIFDDVLWPFLQQVHEMVRASNPGLGPTQVILTGTPLPNAFSMGNGTIVVYTGLLSELENEAQLAFVLCHEIAHFELQHAPNLLVSNIGQYNSKEFQDKLKKVRNASYNTSELIEELFMNSQFKERFHRRDKERQADSLAYHLYKNTGYDLQHPLKLLKRFEQIDQISADSVMHLETYLGCQNFPFQKKWNNAAITSVWGDAVAAKKENNKKLEDSLSTHPDSKLRLMWLEGLMNTPLKDGGLAITPKFEQIRRLSAIENVNTLLQNERLDRAIYRAILYRQRYPDIDFFQEAILLSLNGMYVHLKRHDLHGAVSTNSPYYPERFNSLLRVLNNLRLTDLLELQSCMVRPAADTDREYELYGGYLYQLAKENKAKAYEYKRRYRSLYPKGRFIASMKDAE